MLLEYRAGVTLMNDTYMTLVAFLSFCFHLRVQVVAATSVGKLVYFERQFKSGTNVILPI